MKTRRNITLDDTLKFIENQLATLDKLESKSNQMPDVSEEKNLSKFDVFQKNISSIVHQSLAEHIKEQSYEDTLYLHLRNKKTNDFMMKTYLFEILSCSKSPFQFFIIFFSLIHDIHSQILDDIAKKEYLIEIACLLHDYASHWAEQSKNWHTAILSSLTKKCTLDEEVKTAKENLMKEIMAEKKFIETMKRQASREEHDKSKLKEKQTLKYILYGAGILVTGLGLFALSKKLSSREIKSSQNSIKFLAKNLS